MSHTVYQIGHLSNIWAETALILILIGPLIYYVSVKIPQKVPKISMLGPSLTVTSLLLTIPWKKRVGRNSLHKCHLRPRYR